jgi:hypothetical protein
MQALNQNRRAGLLEKDLAEFEPIDESDNTFTPQKSKIVCICPMCDQKHTMNIVWIGRGSPRKYCQNCKGSL